MGTRAVLFIQRAREASIQQQTAACLRYAVEAELAVYAIAPYWAPQDAVALIDEGICDIVLVAFESRAALALAADIDGRGRVVCVHPEPKVLAAPRHLPDLVELILRWRRRGKSIKEIARDIEENTGEIRTILRTAGEYPPRSD